MGGHAWEGRGVPDRRAHRARGTRREGARADRARGVPAQPRRLVPLVRLQDAVSPVSAGPGRVPDRGGGCLVNVPPQIVEAFGAEPTEEQWTAISWPLEPCV